MTGKKIHSQVVVDPQDMVLQWAQECAARRRDQGLTCDSCPRLERCERVADKIINRMYSRNA